MNPDEPRFGVEISNDRIYTCQENITNKENYNYYSGDLDSNIFKDIENDLVKVFDGNVKSGNIVDATPYQLDFTIGGKERKIKFYFHYLSQEQINVINKIINLKDNDFKKIEYHKFPLDLLNKKLPEPPPAPNFNDVNNGKYLMISSFRVF